MQHPSTLGDAYWSDPEDIAKRFAYKDGESFWLGRNPQRFEDMIGSMPGDDTHVGLFGKTRGAKGRSFIVPNLIKWKGSVVSIDPKGENASICAARRAYGDGKRYAGQDTYVLDPNRTTKNVPEELFASCNLLDCLDPEDPAMADKCTVLVDALTIKPAGGESADWSGEGIRWTALVMAHVVTHKYVPAKSRHLGLVRDFVLLGNEQAVEQKRQFNRKKQAEYDADIAKWREAGSPEAEEPSEPDLWPKIHPIDQLLDEISENPAVKGNLAKSARKFRNIRQDSPKQWAGIYGHATRELEFLNNVNIETSVFGASKENQRALDIKGIKSNPDGVSIFICLKGRGGDPAIRWQRALLALICQEMQEWQGMPACGHPMLMSIDEFLDLKHMEQIKTVLNQGAGAGIKLFLSILNISGLNELYGEHGGEQILAGLDTKIWLGLNDNVTPKWLENHLGEAHIEIQTASDTKGKSRAKSETHTKSKTTGTSGGKSRTEGAGHSWGTAVTDGTNENTTDTISDAHTSNRGRQWSVQEGTSLGRNQSSTRGRQSGRSFQPGQLFKTPFPATSDGVNSSVSDGSQFSRNKSRSGGGQSSKGRTISTARAKSAGTQHSETRNETFNTQSSETYNEGWMKSETDAESIGTVDTEQESRTTQQTLHKRPLLTRPLFNRLTRTFSERDHPFYPGLALITVGGEDAFFVLKSHYDEDPEFVGLFTPHYAYPYIPFERQRLLGAQYTDEHMLPIRLPDLAMEQNLPISVQVHVPCDEWFAKGDPLLTWKMASPLDPNLFLKVTLTAPSEGKVIDIDMDFAESGDIMCVRTEVPLREHERQLLYDSTYRKLFQAFDDKEAADARRRAENAARAKAEAKKREAREDEEFRRRWEAEAAARDQKRRQEVEFHTTTFWGFPAGVIFFMHFLLPIAVIFDPSTSADSIAGGAPIVFIPGSITIMSLMMFPFMAALFWIGGLILRCFKPQHDVMDSPIDQLSFGFEGIEAGFTQFTAERIDAWKSEGAASLVPFFIAYGIWYAIASVLFIGRFVFFNG